MEKGYEFLVDSREKKELTLSILKRKEIPHRVTALAAGDFALRNLNVKPVKTVVGIERKSIPDLMHSIQSKRIFEQCKRLVDLYEIPYLMISGSTADYLQRMDDIKLKVNLNVIYGTLASLSVKGGVQVMWFPDDVTLVEVAYRICTKVSEGKYMQGLGKKPKYLTFTPKNTLMNIPGVSSRIADDLLNRFGTLKSIAIADAEELQLVNGVGDKLAGSIRRLFDREH